MPLFPLLFYILFGAVLFGGGGALLQNMTPPTHEHRSENTVSTKPPAKARPEMKEAKREPVSRPETRAPVAPAFDVVRIEKNGDGVMAGRAEPGWTVIVEANGKEIARSKVAADGEWALVLDKPLPAGEYSIGLRALSPGAVRGLGSGQTVMASVAGEKTKEKTVVALSEPGQPTRVLTPKEQEPSGSAAESSREPERIEKTEAPAVSGAPKKTETGTARDEAAVKPASSGQSEVVVSFSAVDYEVGDNGNGKLFLSGEAAAGARVKLYLDNNRVGEAVAGDDGTWTFESLRTLPPEKRHTMRADAIQADGQVTSRAEVGFTPPVPEPGRQVAAGEESKPQTAHTPRSRERETQMAADEPGSAAKPGSAQSVRPALQAQPEPERQVAAGEEPKPETAPKPESSGQVALLSQPEVKAASKEAQPAAELNGRQTALAASAAEEKQSREPEGSDLALKQKRSIVVRRGDTLWHIAKRRYGSGTRYTAIYRDNRKQIRNPHWIYPGQEFSLPPN